MIPKNITKRVILFLTIIVTIELIFMTWSCVDTSRKAVFKEQERNLVEIVSRLENDLPQSYEKIIETNQTKKLSESERRQSLNRYLQPIVDKVAAEWPGYGMGYYEPDLKILALSPYNENLLGRTAAEEALKVYEQKKLLITEIQNAFTWEGYTILAANQPIFKDGQLIGHVWANTKIQNINMEILKNVIHSVIITILIWFTLIFLIWWSIHKIENCISELITQIDKGTGDFSKFEEVPQLVPVLETVENLKTNLQKEYQERHLMLQELSRLDRLNIVGEMAASVTHEIRNPMTVIMGFVQIIAGKNKESAKEFDIILEELNRVNQIIEDFLSMARSKVIPKCLRQLNTIVESIYHLVYAEAVNKGVTMEMNLQKDLPALFLEEKEIKQVVLNLLRNAIEAMDSEGILQISTHYDEQNNYLLLSIRDNGSGIPEENLKDIFNPFYTTKENGTGLGLSVCKNIIEKHGGTISVASTVGEGTLFQIKLPLNLT
ncbi:MAG: Sporulation kinase E [Candidatus Dichloromethanomonas elyunquensis]|nr:MAG: Sporulation kinase E [Candidatus Dichloromethanomonas elyunquensis]